MGQGRVRTEDWGGSERMSMCHPLFPVFIGRRRGGFVQGCTCPLCTSVKDRRLCPEMNSLHQPTLCSAYWSRNAHIFPPEGDSALDTIYIPHCVVPGRHLAITRFAFDNVHPTSAYCVSFCAPAERSTRRDLTLPQRDMPCHVGR